MLKDIELLTDKNVGVAVVNELNNELNEVWNVYLINFNNKPINDVLVTCKGYGQIDNEPRETSTMRYFLGDVDEQHYTKVEPLNPDLFVLNNEYFLTFYENNNILDKKLTFKANTISHDLLTDIAIIGKKGILLT